MAGYSAADDDDTMQHSVKLLPDMNRVIVVLWINF